MGRSLLVVGSSLVGDYFEFSVSKAYKGELVILF